MHSLGGPCGEIHLGHLKKKNYLKRETARNIKHHDTGDTECRELTREAIQNIKHQDTGHRTQRPDKTSNN